MSDIANLAAGGDVPGVRDVGRRRKAEADIAARVADMALIVADQEAEIIASYRSERFSLRELTTGRDDQVS